MMMRLAALLAVLPALALAGVTGLDTPETATERPAGTSDADWLDRFVSTIDGLAAPLFTDTPAPPRCDGSERGVTRGFLVSAGQSMEIEHYWLDGPPNDVALIGQSLILRGAAAENVVTLDAAEATHAGVAVAARGFLDAVGCGDSVLVHVSAFAFDAGTVGLGPEGGPFGPEPKEKMLADLGGGAFSIGVGDRVIAGGPFAVLNFSAPGRGDVLSAAALSEFVTVLRNRGADVAVSLDVASAVAFDLEGRQAKVDPQTFPRLALPGQCVTGCDPRPGDWAPTLLDRQAGALTVFYSSAAGDPGVETGFPRGAPDRKTYGLFSYGLASAIAQADRTTIGALARHIEGQADMAKRRQAFTFVTTAPDRDLIAEERPDLPVQDGRIIIDTPEITRAALKLPKAEVEVRGRIAARGAPVRVTINDRDVSFAANGDFAGVLPLQAGVNKVKVFATTTENEMLRYDFELSYEGDIRAVIGEGKRYAVLIANEDYSEASGYGDLSTPIGDAEALAELLRSRYGFVTEAELPGGGTVDLFLKNAGMQEIALTLGDLAQVAGARDSVLIFYAGHGDYIEENGRAYWLPVDARHQRTLTYLDAEVIAAELQLYRAGNVLVISDSCYSGMLLRSGVVQPERPGEDRLKELQRLAEKRSRVVISSGGEEPVLDGGGGGHSVFARALLDALERPEVTEFSAAELFDRVRSEVVKRAPQTPDFRPITGAGHDGGDFVFLYDGG